MSLALGALIILFRAHIPFLDLLNLKIYDKLAQLEYRLGKAPGAIKDMVIVTIDNDTLQNIPDRWPYPRSYFAKAIENLNKSGARLVAFDFIFLGRSSQDDDALLIKAIKDAGNIVLPSSVNEKGELDFVNLPVLADLKNEISMGIITKLQDEDGITRRNLTYLLNDKKSGNGFLSWEMQILKIALSADLSSISDKGNELLFKSISGKAYSIPVDRDIKSFYIHFRGHTKDFDRISFHKLVGNDFDPALVKGRIVLVGLVSNLFEDLHNTPIGWLPGIAVNANAFLTLYAGDFLVRSPPALDYVIIAIGIAIAALIVSLFKPRPALFLIALETVLFYIISFAAFSKGYVLDYTLFPLVVYICPAIANKFIG